MCAIGFFLEQRGLATTGIALVRENAEALRPPRLLWTPFPLGRPLGVPADPNFQTDVIRHALELLERPDGPVLEDYPRDAPATHDEAPTCPVSFARHEPITWAERLAMEHDELAAWYEIAVRKNGRTAVGLVDRPVALILESLGGLLDRHGASTTAPNEAFFADVMEAGVGEFKFGLEDAKSFYQEALAAQPGHRDPRTVHDWLWQESTLGAALIAVFGHFATHPKLHAVGRVLVPRSALGRSTG